ncbi:MAG TPA: phosphoglycolate phosphatase [Holophaga sp.]|nr:phosphoglycolate phosphatase [Holophaga sp.]
MTQQSAVRAILIDLDGTLMDTAPDLAAAANLMRGDFGLPPLSESRIASYVGKGADVLIHRALTDDLDGRVDAAGLDRGRESFYGHYHATNGRETVVFEGVSEALELLVAGGWTLACVTNKPREFTVPLLERWGLARWFSAVVAGDDVKAPKPDPDLLLAACGRLGCPPERALMIGDSVNDALAARAAGMQVLLVETGYNEGQSVDTLQGEPGVILIAATLLDAARYILGSSDGLLC